MQETKDPAIKLFGKMIPLQSAAKDPAISRHGPASHMAIDAEKGGGDDGGQKKRQDDEADKELQIRKVTERPEEKESEQLTETAKSSKNDDGAKSEEKILKKPDQVLPCPRCCSMNTKFCYYNNYSINQPRHFCKSCQRYWTAGGTMRNVPVGAGRRKTKNNSSQLRYVTINEALRVARIRAPNNGTNGKVLSFGSDSPTGSVLNHVENKVLSKSTRNEFHNRILEHQRNTYSIEESKKNSTFQDSCLPGVPWPVPPGFPPPSSNHPAPFWNYGANLPRFSTNSSPPTLKSSSSGSNSPRSGKYTRDEAMLGTGYLQEEEGWKQRNGSALVPKTLRIDDPSEAAKSSIWTTLGIRKEPLNGGSMFDASQWSKVGKDQKRQRVETSLVLRANPAALSRSVYFHEHT